MCQLLLIVFFEHAPMINFKMPKNFGALASILYSHYCEIYLSSSNLCEGYKISIFYRFPDNVVLIPQSEHMCQHQIVSTFVPLRKRRCLQIHNTAIFRCNFHFNLPLFDFFVPIFVQLDIDQSSTHHV